MFKLLVFIFLLFNYINADITLTKDKFDALLNKEIAIVTAIISKIENKGIKPTTIGELKNDDYLPSDFESSNLIDGNNITFTISNKAITIDTNIVVSKLHKAEIDYYLNNIKSSIVKSSNNTGTNLTTTYYLSRKAINILNTNQNLIGNEEPISNQGDIWFDSNIKEFDIKKKIGSFWSDITSTNQNLSKDGTFIYPKTLPIAVIVKDFTNVNITEETKAIECRNLSATYNQQLNRCEAYTSDACDGNYFDTVTGKCYFMPIDYCKANGFDGYDINKKQCFKEKTIPTIDVPIKYTKCFNLNFGEAYQYCKKLASEKYLGYSNWRLPYLHETQAENPNGIKSCSNWTWTMTESRIPFRGGTHFDWKIWKGTSSSYGQVCYEIGYGYHHDASYNSPYQTRCISE